ncbi:hypothetical protein ACN26Y_20430 [Micromonospora sp. WMMD558]|uniref:hypothetical protein n=1 Tax=Micromonospora sp. WMMD558 TaxID=3403462 RepID=UPI003BF5DC31
MSEVVAIIATLVVGGIVTAVLCVVVHRKWSANPGAAVLLGIIGVAATILLATVARPVERLWDSTLGPLTSDPEVLASPVATAPIPSTPAAPPTTGSMSPPTETASPSPDISDDTEGTPDTSATPDLPATLYLSEYPAIKNNGARGTFSMDGVAYSQSKKVYCGETPSASVWSVAGYQTMDATIGIADNEKRGLGVIGRMSFRNEDNQDLIPPVDVSLGSPKKVTVQLKGAVQLQIGCVGRERDSGTSQGLFYAVLGDAYLNR